MEDLSVVENAKSETKTWISYSTIKYGIRNETQYLKDAFPAYLKEAPSHKGALKEIKRKIFDSAAMSVRSVVKTVLKSFPEDEIDYRSVIILELLGLRAMLTPLGYAIKLCDRYQKHDKMKGLTFNFQPEILAIGCLISLMKTDDGAYKEIDGKRRFPP